MKRILIVEDDAALAEGLKLNAELEGYEAVVASSAEEGLEWLERGGADLILLDVSLPGEDGFEFCAQLRRRSDRTPVLFLTARDEDSDRVRGLAVGGDDYVVKPFHLAELLARIRALFRRQSWERLEPSSRPSRVEIGTSTIDFERSIVETPRRTFDLGEKEAGLIALLVEHEGRPVSRQEILDRVWGVESFPTTRTVDNFILKLRRMLEPDPTAPRHLLTVHGVGYRLVREGRPRA